MAIYDVSFMDNATNPMDLITGVAAAVSTSQYMIGNFILLAFMVLFIFLGIRGDTMVSFLVGSYFTTILAIIFAATNLVAWPTVVIPAVMTFTTTIMAFFIR